MTQGAAADGRDADYEACVADYHASRARHIRSVTAGVEQRVRETIGKRRGPLTEEIANLTTLAHSRFDVYQVALNAYAAKARGRVRGTQIMRPSPAERVVPGIDKLYKAALTAADEFREVNDIIKKRKDKLDEIDQRMRVQVEQYGRDLIAQLETPSGLEGAFKRDPLLGRAYARMLAAQNRRAYVMETT